MKTVWFRKELSNVLGGNFPEQLIPSEINIIIENLAIMLNFIKHLDFKHKNDKC